MLTLDTIGQERMRQQAGREAALEQRTRLLAENLERQTLTVADDGGHDTTNLLSQMGRPMTGKMVVEKLKKCNSRLHFERSIAYPNLMGVYLLIQERTITGAWEQKKKHLFGMEAGMMPEFSVRHKKTVNVANPDLLGQKRATRDVDWKKAETFVDETRGWRTVLVRLLHAGLITEADVQRHFGWSPSRDSKNWKDRTS